jgi:LysR family transcriptional regulator, transcriptional activator of the cysJI operon
VTDLAGSGFIIREPGSGTRDVFENVMQAAQVSWKAVGVYNNIEAIKLAVRANLGLGVVPRISIIEEVRLGAIVPIEVEGLKLTRKFNFIYHKQKFFSEAMRAFIDCSRER